MLEPRERTGPVRRLRRGALCALTAVCVLGVLAPLAAEAKQDSAAFVPQSLLDAAAARPDAVYKVVVQGEGASNSRDVAGTVAAEIGANPGRGKGLKRKFLSISGVSAELTGKQILKLATKKGILAITPDAPLRLSLGTGEPEAVAAPVVSGVAREGETLSASAGEWAGDAPLSYGYQWQRCSAEGRAALAAGDAPVARWRLGETGGATAVAAAGAGLDGSYLGGVRYGLAGVTGAGDSAVGFDGTSAYVDVAGGSNLALAGAFTLEVWVKANAAEHDRGLLGRWSAGGGGALLWLDELGHYGLAVTTDHANYVTTTVAPTPGAWEHIVGSWDGTILRLYRNGSQIGSQPFTGSTGAPAPLKLANYGDGTHYFDGALDEAAVYDHALSPQQIRTHYLGCQPISGATNPTYTLTSADRDTSLRVLVTATNPAGTSSQSSEPTTTIAGLVAPTNTASPTLAGVAIEGNTLTATTGTWTADPAPAYTYQWQRCDGAGLACTDVGDATGTTYNLTWTDIGQRLKVVVRASNVAGAGSAASDASAPIAEGTGYSTHQLWPYVARVASLWPSETAAQAPTIAIVDSGIDAARADFGGRVLQEVTLTSLVPNSNGDGRGHGTFVASIAAGEAHGHTGAAPNAKLVSLDVFDDNGMATVSDVIAAADWIYANKDTYGIRVANFSLTGTVASSVKYDPLDRAVEKLWLSGVVVVAAVGNYAVGGAESGVPYAPGNDPFVISVGADDSLDTISVADDVAAPWSAFGYTPDGFTKPELGAPGRYLVGAVPPGSTLALERPAQVVEPGYMQLSGTSFAAPIVAGAAAELLAAHPAWTPDQVKGALMLAALPVPAAVARSLGVGVLDAAQAAAVVDPPNPNLALRDFVVADPAGGPTPVFDAAAWGQAAAANPAWASAAWGQAAWGQAAWGQAAWGQTYWSSAAWGQGTSGDLSAPTSNAESDVLPSGGYWITPAQLADAQNGGR